MDHYLPCFGLKNMKVTYDEGKSMKIDFDQTEVQSCNLDAGSIAILQEYGNVEKSKKESLLKTGWKENPSKWDKSDIITPEAEQAMGTKGEDAGVKPDL